MKKICSKCKENKPLEEFYKHASTKDGKRPDCKSCVAAKSKKYRAKNKQQIAKRKKKYQENHKEKIAEYQKSYYTDNKKELLKYHKKYQVKHTQRISKYQKNYYTDNKKELRNKQKEYFKTEKGKLAKIRSTYNRRSKKRNILNTLKSIEANIIIFLQNYKCANPNCEHGRFFDGLKPTTDHIVPVNDGGPLIKENIQYLCQSCNSKKHIQTIDYRTEMHKQIITNLNYEQA